MSIYAVDFDGTLANTKFPRIVSPKIKVVTAVKVLKAQGHKIILWTSRKGKDLEDAVKWCEEKGIKLDAVNGPLPEQIVKWGDDTRKVYADFYIDDKAVKVSEIEESIDGIEEIMKEYLNRDPHKELLEKNFEEKEK